MSEKYLQEIEKKAKEDTDSYCLSLDIANAFLQPEADTSDIMFQLTKEMDLTRRKSEMLDDIWENLKTGEITELEAHTLLKVAKGE